MFDLVRRLAYFSLSAYRTFFLVLQSNDPNERKDAQVRARSLRAGSSLKFKKFAHQLLHPAALIVGEMTQFPKGVEPVLPVGCRSGNAAENKRPHGSAEVRDLLFNEYVRLHL
ncbi:hypothetical protein V4C53_07555 [Paraburkholderia azotifigens]|uniref:hypothetical protein n=1 Tax=Paraburkholderia azotifigens TaxID=2057004 RepID=UPI0012DE50C5